MLITQMSSKQMSIAVHDQWADDMAVCMRKMLAKWRLCVRVFGAAWSDNFEFSRSNQGIKVQLT